ncbi:hypothetical protein GCM10018966_075140 [Streptomyces yanii]
MWAADRSWLRTFAAPVARAETDEDLNRVVAVGSKILQVRRCPTVSVQRCRQGAARRRSGVCRE